MPSDAHFKSAIAAAADVNETLARVWEQEYIRNGLCMLCGNSGKIDTIGRVRGPRHQNCGGKAHCICPNGRRRKELGHPL